MKPIKLEATMEEVFVDQSKTETILRPSENYEFTLSNGIVVPICIVFYEGLDYFRIFERKSKRTLDQITYSSIRKALTATEKMLEKTEKWFELHYANTATFKETLEKNKKVASQNKERMAAWKELTKIIGFTAPLDGLISAFSGQISLDIIKFDKMLRVPDGISTKNYIIQTYGERAAELTELLIS